MGKATKKDTKKASSRQASRAMQQAKPAEAPTMTINRPPAAAPPPQQVPQATQQGIPQYDEVAEYNYYNEALRKALRETNPGAFDNYIASMQNLAKQGPVEYTRQGAHNLAMKAKAQGFTQSLTEDQIRQVLSRIPSVGGQNAYQRFVQLRPRVMSHDFGVIPRSTYNGYSIEDVSPMRSSGFSADSGERYEVTVTPNGQLVRRFNAPLQRITQLMQN